MAVTFESSASSGWATATAHTVTKPTSLAEGDLLLAFFAGGVSAPGELDDPSGVAFTDLDTNDAGVQCWRLAYRVADASDAAASDFAFTTEFSSLACVHLARISGHALDFDDQVKDSQTSASTTTFGTLDLTPRFASSVVVFCGLHYNSGSGGGATSAHAMATDNPSWTEAHDEVSSDHQIFMAYGPRTATTATGDFSVDYSTTGGTVWAVSLALHALVSPTVEPAVISVSSKNNATMEPEFSGLFPINVALATPAPTVTTIAPTWTDVSKSTTTWTNQNKS